LRQPLQALGLFVATLVQRPLPDDIKDIVGKIESSLEALEHLLDGLLDISRLDAGAIEAHSVAFPLQSLFDRMALEFEPLAERKGLALRLVHTSATVRSDPALLERILRNLLSNAIRYTRSGGVVVGCRRQGMDLRIEVWDSGSGIAASDQKEIFREFRQLDDSFVGERQGLGLGLAIVERLTNLLGLQIALRSEVGKGSMFAIVLPFAGRLTDRARIGYIPLMHAD
jgi:signal transduction histidine kinase